MAEKDFFARDWEVIQVPYGGGFSSLNISKPKGTRNAPKVLYKEFTRQRIFIADNSVFSWDNVLWRKINLKFKCCQNNINGWEKMHEKVFKQSADIFRGDKKVLFLGGSHTITVSTYSALAQKNGQKNTGLIVLDAHPDCCSKSSWPIHSDWLRWLVEGKYILPENILIIGLRQVEAQEKIFLDKYDIICYPIEPINLKPGENIVRDDISMLLLLEELRKLTAIYISIDIDVASGIYAPGTGCPSPGGFTDRELLSLVKQFKLALPNLRAADIVEINPLNWWRKKILRYDPTVDLGVKLIKEIIS